MNRLALLPLLMFAFACNDTTAPQNDASLSPSFDFANSGNPNAAKSLVGSWELTMAEDGNGEIPIGDLALIVTYRSDGTSSVAVSNDLTHQICEAPQTSCTWDGTYTYTATEITGNEVGGPEPGEDTGHYAFCGNRLIYMDSGYRNTYKKVSK